MKLYALFFLFSILLVNSASATLSSGYKKDTIPNYNNENQIKKKTLSIGLVLSRFSPSMAGKESNLKTSLFNLGGESLINFKLHNNITISTGVHYQYGKIEKTFIKERTIFGELSLPLIMKIPLSSSITNEFYLSTGVYIGQYIHVKMETKGGNLVSDNKWHEFPIEYIDGYSSENLITDFYFGLGYSELANKNGLFHFNLFAKYRLNEHWLNQHVSKLIFGVKINHFFKF
ncbi:MAG: hypothetical protein L3J11_11750 [Draconibacterium sp.]|nr:hypothetical protein [Draconibacterium sp.]